ncbi:Proteasome activator 28 [Diplonema papillatum]|nr:Proteasome activator 28 [Diplonema papillatum]
MVKRQKSGSQDATKQDAESALKGHRQELYAKLDAFTKDVPQLVARYLECKESVKKMNPNNAPTTSSHDATSHSEKKRKLHDETPAPTTPKSILSSGKNPVTTAASLAQAARSNVAATVVSLPTRDVKEAKDLSKPPDNSLLLGALRHIRTEALELSRTLCLVGSWIDLMVPEYKGEDNDGVEVQSLVGDQLDQLEKEASMHYGMEPAYLETRARYESKYYKHFLAPSWIQVIDSFDKKVWDELEQAWNQMIHNTLLAHARLSINMEKLKNPRSETKSAFMMM